MAIAFVPQVKRASDRKDRFDPPAKGSIGICCEQVAHVAAFVRDMFPRYDIAAIAPGVADTISIAVVDDEKLRASGYRLRISKDGIKIEAESVEAAWNAAQTLRQVVDQSGKTLPGMTVTDWPDFAVRGLYEDVTRGRVPQLESLKMLVDQLSAVKVNHLQLYIEHVFQFRNHPLIGKNCSPLSAEDILELDAYCIDRHIDFVPSLATFGHMAKILTLEPYRELAEDRGVGDYVYENPWKKRKKPLYGWTLSPANPKVYEFLDSLFAEFLPLFSSDMFNVCCDETWDLGYGQTHDLCQKKGKGQVYLDHILRLRDMAAKYGKRIQFWGDIILHYPELIAQIPDDVVVLDWGYRHDKDYTTVEKFEKAGLEYYGCPGVAGWAGIFNRVVQANLNIRGFAQAAAAHGATGLLNTDWGDGGHQNFTEFSWHGIVLGAEQAWNVKGDADTYTQRFMKTTVGDDAKELVKAFDELADLSTLYIPGAYGNAWYFIYYAAPGDDALTGASGETLYAEGGKMKKGELTFDAKFGKKCAKRFARVRDVLAKYAKKRGIDPMGLLPYWLFGCEVQLHAAEKLATLGPGGSDNAQARRALRKDMTRLQKQFEKLWMARSHRSEIRQTLQRYRRVLKKL